MKIYVDSFDGGTGISREDAPNDIATALRDIADDLANLKPAAPAALTSSQEATADAAAQTGAYVQADVQSIATLANDLKAKYNQLQVDVAAIRTLLANVNTAAALKTTKG